MAWACLERDKEQFTRKWSLLSLKCTRTTQEVAWHGMGSYSLRDYYYYWRTGLALEWLQIHNGCCGDKLGIPGGGYGCPEKWPQIGASIACL